MNSHVHKNEIKKLVSFTIASKRKSTQEFNKEVQDLYTENYKTFLREIKDLNKRRDSILLR